MQNLDPDELDSIARQQLPDIWALIDRADKEEPSKALETLGQARALLEGTIPRPEIAGSIDFTNGFLGSEEADARNRIG